jgi:hypothetical protein
MKIPFKDTFGLWILTTGLYLLIYWSFGGLNISSYPLFYFIRFLGLFVPFGFFSVLGVLEKPLVWVIFFGGIILSDFISEQLKLTTPKRILVGLFFLFIITMCADLIIWGNWCSLKMFLGKGCGAFN